MTEALYETVGTNLMAVLIPLGMVAGLVIAILNAKTDECKESVYAITGGAVLALLVGGSLGFVVAAIWPIVVAALAAFIVLLPIVAIAKRFC